MTTDDHARSSVQQVVVRPSVVGASLGEWSGGPVGAFSSFVVWTQINDLRTIEK